MVHIDPEPSHRWSLPIGHLVLEPGTAHVWQAGLKLTASRRKDSLELLTEDERVRVARFRSTLDRRRYIAARASLRLVLGRYLGIPAREIHLQYTPEGKPELSPGQHAEDLHFNLSHSGELAMIAIAPVPVGVDLEQVRLDFDYAGIVTGYYSAREQTVLERLEAVDRRQVFYRLWTRKESYQKALGIGLGISPEQVQVIGHQETPGCGRLAGSGEELIPGWWFFDLDPDEGYVGALALPGSNWRLRCFRCGFVPGSDQGDAGRLTRD